MREILFRGQIRRKGEKVNMAGEPLPSRWVYGGIFPTPNDFSVIYGFDPIEKYPVYTETVGQYTGLTDKNGEKIFEGDIMRFSAYGIVYVGKVEFCKGNFGIMCKKACPFLDDAMERHGAVKVGNIYDNPELLEANNG